MRGVKPELEAPRRDNSTLTQKRLFYSNDARSELRSCKYDSCLCTSTGTYRHTGTVGCPRSMMSVFEICHVHRLVRVIPISIVYPLLLLP